MAHIPPKLLLKLIFIGILASGAGCYESDGGKEYPADSGDSDSRVLSDADTEADTDTDTDTCRGVACLAPTDTDNAVETDADSDIEADSETDVDSETTTDTEICARDNWTYSPYTYPIEYLEEVNPAEPKALCTVAETPAESNRAALVTLDAAAGDLLHPHGTITFTPAILDKLVAVIDIRFISSLFDAVEAVTANIVGKGDHFEFDLALPEAALGDWSNIFAEVTFEIRCDDTTDETKQVTSENLIELCETKSGQAWKSSGEDCTQCNMLVDPIAIAPATFPERASRPMDLAYHPNATIVPIAEQGRTLRLFAALGTTTEAVSYHWTSRSGQIENASAPEVVWHLPKEPGPHLIQLVVENDQGVAVTAFRFRHHL